MNYIEILSNVPLPSEEQTRAFARYVAGNHGWYKQLPYFPPGAKFVFYLDPQAGKSQSYLTEEKKIVHETVIDKLAMFPRPEYTTEEYQALYGHWKYFVSDNPRLQMYGLTPVAYDLDDNACPIGEDAQSNGNCTLTAFVSPSPVLWGKFFDNATAESKLAYIAENQNVRLTDKYFPIAELACSESANAIFQEFVEKETIAQNEKLEDALLNSRAWYESVL